MWVVTELHATLPVSIAVSVVTLWLIARRRFYWVATVLLSVFGGMLLNLGLKAIFQRGRPQFQDPIITLTSYSFPSGHTMAATVLYGVMAALLVTGTQNWWKRVVVISLAFVMIALVGFTRIYLGAHYLTDVVAAMAEGLAWLSVSLTGVYYLWRHRHSARD